MFAGIKYMLKYFLKISKSYFVFNIAVRLLKIAITLVLLYFPKLLVDGLTGGQNDKVLFVYSVLIVGSILVCSILITFLERLANYACMKVYYYFFNDLAQRTMTVDYFNLENPDYQDNYSRACNFFYVGGGFGGYLNVLFDMFEKLIAIISIFYIILQADLLLVAIIFGLTMISIFINKYLSSKRIKFNLQIPPIERRSDYIANISTMFEYGKEIRTNKLIKWLQSKFEIYFDQTFKLIKKDKNTGRLSLNINVLFNLLREGIAYGFLIYIYLNARITIGEFVMLLGGIITFGIAMSELFASFNIFKESNKYYEPFKDLIDTKTILCEGNIKLPAEDIEIEFKNVDFQYSGSNVKALENINLKIESNKKYSIVGENGAGKSTFIKLLLKFYDTTKGEILLNGKNIKAYTHNEYMSLLSAVFQDYQLFAFTIAQNIAGKIPDHEERQKIEEICYSLGLGKKINELPNGIDTFLFNTFDENGIHPSGGESQKIAIARALFKNSPLIILDEPTAALDPRAEYELYKSFDKIIENKTAIYISHRLSSCRFCDEVIVFDKGRVIEKGTHEELMLKKGQYFELYSMQSQYYND